MKAIILKAVRIATHAVLYLLAVVIFYLGLGIGLSYSPAYGNLLWLVALAVAAANTWWIMRRFR